MDITHVELDLTRKNFHGGLAEATVEFDHEFRVHGINVDRKNNRLYVMMPGSDFEGHFQFVVQPLTQEFHEEIRSAVVDAYKESMER